MSATQELLSTILQTNKLKESDLVSIIFTGTPDITAAFPAKAARLMGLGRVPLLCAQELDVEGAPGLCVRVLVYVNAVPAAEAIRHIYLNGAEILRPEYCAQRKTRTGLTIAIDGPSGSGKSTVARRLASLLGLRYLDTGAMYRTLTWQAMVRGLCLTDAQALLALLSELNFSLAAGVNLVVNDQPIGDEIRTPAVNQAVSVVAQIPEIRRRLVAIQRELASGGGIVMEGRDIGTEVLPEATLKVFLIADQEVRAARRQLEMQRQGQALVIDEVAEQMRMRDHKDSHRATSPLRAAPDAVTIDCTDLNSEEVVQIIMELATGEAHVSL